MRKGGIVFSIIIIAAVIFYFIKLTQVHPLTETIAVNQKAFSRTILLNEMWNKWWPGKVTSNSNTTYNYKGMDFTLVDKKTTSLLITISDVTDTLYSELIFIPANNDSILLTWSLQQMTAGPSFRHLSLARKIHNLQEPMKEILSAIKNFYSSEQNIYSLQINKSFVEDSILISTVKMYDSFPTNNEIYTLIDKLTDYAKANYAEQTNPPMLNINTTDSVHYRVQVALPVNKKLKDEKDIAYRWMLGRGNILISEVIGGYGTINNGFATIEKYVKDHDRVAPAIPFQQLITNRRNEPDTTQWKTRLCWPVM